MARRNFGKAASGNVRRRLAAGVSSATLALSGAAFAQADDVALVQDPPAADEASRDEVVVTGSRIARPALEAPAPVTSIDSANIQRSGETNLSELLNEVPSLVGSVDNDDSTNAAIGSTGLNNLNLRNLGVNRTLVLVNGRRHVGGSGSSTAVDINTIPVDLIERVDVLTSGTSSIYGADAVTGVVNFIMRDDFEGVSVRAQGGLTPDHGDAENYFASIAAGKNFGDGRGNIVAAFEYSNESGLDASDRDFASSESFALLDNPDFDPNGPDIRQRIFLQDATIAFAAPGGAIALDFFNGFDLLFDLEGDGDPYDLGQPVTFRNTIGGSATRISDLTGSLTSDIKRYVGNVNARYDFNPNVRGFLELKFAQVDSFAESSPAFTDLVPILVNDNPFTPQAIVDAAALAGVDTVFASHDLFELGRRGEDARRRTYRVAGGVETKVLPGTFDNLGLDFSVVYGRTSEQFVATNNLVLDRLYAALDAVVDPMTGQPTCRTNIDPSALPPQIPFPGGFGFLGFFDAFNTTVTPDNFGTTPFFTPGPASGCQPLNLFGLGNASQAAIDFVTDDSLREARIEQLVLSGTLHGDTGGVIDLPAGPIGFAAGLEYRDEKSSDTPPLINTAGLTFGNRIFPTTGSYNVFEGYAEVSVPVIADRTLAKLLRIDGAVRVSDYSTVGSTLAWHAGGVYSPFDDLRFRGTFSIAVRAPNIGELFSPQNQSFFLPDDPCDIDNIPLAADPGLRAANCAAILSPLGVDPTTFQGDDILNATFPGVVGGNPDLKEEKAKTWTVGLVYQPGWLNGFSVAADYFKIGITDGIIAPASQDIVDQCVDLPSINNGFCSLIQRRADGGLSFLEVVPVNVAFFETSGIDYEMNYAFDPADIGLPNIGRFNLRYVGSYLERLDVVSLPGQEADEERDESTTLLGDDAPVHVGALDLTWFYERFSMNYRWRYRDRIFRDEIDEFDAAAAQGVILFEPSRTSALSTHDVQVRYELRDGADVYAGVNNFLDQEPDIGAIGTPVGPVGRFVYAGFSLRF